MPSSAHGEHPPGLLVLCMAELCERFAGCLFLSLLVLYLTERAGVPASAAIRQVGWLNAGGYVASLAGAWLIDRGVRALHAALLGGALLCLGYLALVPTSHATWTTAYAALALGGGLFRAAITLLLTAQYARSSPLRDAGHLWLWGAVNLGGAAAPLFASSIGSVHAWSSALAVAATTMALCVSILWLGRARLLCAGDPLRRQRLPASRHDDATLAGPTSAARVVILASLSLLIYMVAYGQLDGTLLLWARDHTDRSLLGITIPASSFAALPALLVLLLGPLVLALVRRLRAAGHRDNDFAQLRIGLFSVALACMVLLVASLRLPSVPHQSPLWLLACFALLVLGELLIAPLGLALMTRVVAPQHVGLVNALWYAVMAVGFVLAGEFGSLLQHTPQWVCFAALAGVATAAAVGMRGRDLASSSG
jgi:POT family proton-dependent oligopeptide transporter